MPCFPVAVPDPRGLLAHPALAVLAAVAAVLDLGAGGAAETETRRRNFFSVFFRFLLVQWEGGE